MLPCDCTNRWESKQYRNELRIKCVPDKMHCFQLLKGFGKRKRVLKFSDPRSVYPENSRLRGCRQQLRPLWSAHDGKAKSRAATLASPARTHRKQARLKKPSSRAAHPLSVQANALPKTLVQTPTVNRSGDGLYTQKAIPKNKEEM